MNLYDEFEWRGMVYEATPELSAVLRQEKVTAYIGFDPTAASLHVGSLLPVMGLARLQRYGHSPVAIVGGGTGLIGDPSGKSQERQLLTTDQVEANLQGIKAQLGRFLDFEAPSNPARIINNADWLMPLGTMEFLRDVGKYFTVNYMLAKESVKKRVEQEEGLSFTEFSYMILQAYDYLVLHDRYGCTLQMGGSDQWGNITAGIELIRRLRGTSAHGLVFPLVTTASGTKFGKTEEGTVWLSPELTSPFQFYQFWLNTDDRDVIPYLKFFTWLSREEIAELEQQTRRHPEQRRAQETLAREVTEMLHGESALASAQRASRILFGGEIHGMGASDLLQIVGDVPSTSIPRTRLEGDGTAISELVANVGLARSRSEARRLVQSGGIYLNNQRVTDAERRVTVEDSIEGQAVLLRRGSKQYHLVRLL